MSEVNTRIGTPTSELEKLRLRGKDVLTEIVGHYSFAEAFYLAVTGNEPTSVQAKIMDTALVILMDHGLTPTAIVARLVGDSVPDDIQVGMAAGMLMVGNKFAGTTAGMGEILTEGMSYKGDKREWAAEFVKKSRLEKKRIPGFGHPYYKSTDPRADRLFEIARDAGVKGDYIELLTILGEEIDRAAGRHLVMNATACLGAILKEIDFPVEVMRALPAVGRAAGLAAHIHEERTSPIVPEIINCANRIPYEE